MLDVRRMRVLREVAAQRSFSAAAEKLGYTQSAVSQQIAALEREAGATLIERNPRGMLPYHARLPPKGEEGGDDVKSAWLLRLGLHTRYNGRYNAQPPREGERIAESRSQFGSQAATRLREAGIASNAVSERWREYVPGPCTHRPSHHESGLY